ncbi:MAG: YARHG domain-containing protein [Crocinitomicaceae bacterium]|nr:YARHG domain-containing protein [Crocinitomicaceae bacterium]
MAKKILRNLPFARRGYIFKNAELQAYYTRMNWYIPNQNYEALPELLTEQEKTWIEKFSE